MLAHQPQSTQATLARAAGLTKRQVARVISDLLSEGYVRVEVQGNRRRYEVVQNCRIDGRPAFSGITVGDLLPIAAALLDGLGEESQG